MPIAKLIINPTSSSRREIPLPRTILSIGRDPSNDLVLPDAMVSRRHAVIEYRASQYYLRDCSSSNGSLVNGDRVSERSLRDGDLVAIGTARLLFREEAELEEAGAKIVQHPSAPRQQCPSCSADYRKGDLFCRQCGTQLAQAAPKAVCTSCGTAVPLPAKFCNACGSPLKKDGLEATRPRAIEEAATGPSPAAEAPALAPLAPDAEPVAVVGPSDATPVASEPDLASEPRTPPPSASSLPSVEAIRPNRSSAAVEPALPGKEPELDTPARLRAAWSQTPVPAERPRPLLPARPESFVPQQRRAAGFGRRLAAGLIDSVIVSLGWALLLAPIAFYFWPLDATREIAFVPILLSVSLLILVLVLTSSYYVYFWGVRAATPGKRMLGLEIETERGALPIGMPKALLRLVGYLLSGVLLGIGFVMIAFGGAGLHDRIAGTRVVRRGGH